MAGPKQLRDDLPEAMTMGAFFGIAWYICIELNVRLFVLFRRKRGLYFWSCLLASWGVLTQPLLIILADFGVFTNFTVAVVLIYLSWWIMVIPQSVVLYSRLHLVMRDSHHIRWVLYMIVLTTIFISIPTMVLGSIAQATQKPILVESNRIWDRIQVTIFFVQETVISLTYVFATRRFLADMSMLNDKAERNTREIMHYLMYTNLLVIFLDITLLALSYSPFFYVQAAYKVCVYGVKLRIEFAILNRLIAAVQRPASAYFSKDLSTTQIGGSAWKKSIAASSTPGEVRLDTFSCHDEESGEPIVQGGVFIESKTDDHDGIVQTTEISVVPSAPEKTTPRPDIGPST